MIDRYRYSSVPVVMAIAMLAAGCLKKEITHTLCLSPAGEVTWIAAETNVYSDASEPAGRRAEEREYITGASTGRHPIALALEALRPAGQVRTRILRDEAPFFVVTDARFPSIETVMQQLLEETGGSVSVHLNAHGRRSTLTIEIDFSPDAPARDTPVSAIVNDLDHLRIVMTEGRFVAATGFDIVDGTVATLSDQWMKEAEKVYEAKGSVQMTLIWETGPV
jgi:hypothetical protein